MVTRIKVGLVGTSQLSFPGKKDEELGKSVKAMELLSHELGFDLFVYPEMVITPADAAAAVKRLEEEKTDLLIIHTVSFSAGTLVPVLAKIKNAKIALWGIPEGANKGIVPLNSFCSINMYGSIIRRYLKDYNIKFKWLFGYADDARFKRRLSITVRALTALKALKTSRIALIGGIAPGFNDLYFRFP